MTMTKNIKLDQGLCSLLSFTYVTNVLTSLVYGHRRHKRSEENFTEQSQATGSSQRTEIPTKSTKRSDHDGPTGNSAFVVEHKPEHSVLVTGGRQLRLPGTSLAEHSLLPCLNTKDFRTRFDL